MSDYTAICRLKGLLIGAYGIFDKDEKQFF